jgi:N-acylneuraminate cytidylyltransferase
MSAKLTGRVISNRLRQCKLLVLDFDGVLTDNTVTVDEHGTESVSCSRSDGLGIEILRMFTDVETLIISSEVNPATVARAKKLKIPAVTGCHDKSQALRKMIDEKHLKPGAVAYVGNDLNDIGCMRIAGISIAVANSASQVLEIANYVTVARGGHGAVREVCEMVVMAKQIDIITLLK